MIKFKVVVAGAKNVGKTSLIRRYATGKFEKSTLSTIGVDFETKKVVVDDTEILLNIWDFAGEDKFRFLLPGVTNGANGTIFMFDITRYVTFENLSNWLSVFNTANENHNQTVPVLLVGSKTDLEGIRTVPFEEAKSFAQDNKLIGYIECSSKNGENVEELFRKITKVMIDKVKK